MSIENSFDTDKFAPFVIYLCLGFVFFSFAIIYTVLKKITFYFHQKRLDRWMAVNRRNQEMIIDFEPLPSFDSINATLPVYSV